MTPFFVTTTILQRIELLAAEVLAKSVISLKNPKDVLADAAKTLPSTSAGTLSLQARIFGFGATIGFKMAADATRTLQLG